MGNMEGKAGSFYHPGADPLAVEPINIKKYQDFSCRAQGENELNKMHSESESRIFHFSTVLSETRTLLVRIFIGSWCCYATFSFGIQNECYIS